MAFSFSVPYVMLASTAGRAPPGMERTAHARVTRPAVLAHTARCPSTGRSESPRVDPRLLDGACLGCDIGRSCHGCRLDTCEKGRPITSCRSSRCAARQEGHPHTTDNLGPIRGQPFTSLSAQPADTRIADACAFLPNGIFSGESVPRVHDALRRAPPEQAPSIVRSLLPPGGPVNSAPELGCSLVALRYTGGSVRVGFATLETAMSGPTLIRHISPASCRPTRDRPPTAKAGCNLNSERSLRTNFAASAYIIWYRPIRSSLTASPPSLV